jgi:hypothetical protein
MVGSSSNRDVSEHRHAVNVTFDAQYLDLVGEGLTMAASETPASGICANFDTMNLGAEGKY